MLPASCSASALENWLLPSQPEEVLRTASRATLNSRAGRRAARPRSADIRPQTRAKGSMQRPSQLGHGGPPNGSSTTATAVASTYLSGALQQQQRRPKPAGASHHHHGSGPVGLPASHVDLCRAALKRSQSGMLLPGRPAESAEPAAAAGSGRGASAAAGAARQDGAVVGHGGAGGGGGMMCTAGGGVVLPRKLRASASHSSASMRVLSPYTQQAQAVLSAHLGTHGAPARRGGGGGAGGGEKNSPKSAEMLSIEAHLSESLGALQTDRANSGGHSMAFTKRRLQARRHSLSRLSHIAHPDHSDLASD